MRKQSGGFSVWLMQYAPQYPGLNLVAFRVLRYLFSLFFLLSFGLSTFSQENDVRFTHLTSAQGLSQSMVRCILKDRYGFMWFGTENGLNKYDGYKFTVFRNNPKDPKSISSNYIEALSEDANGTLWVATDAGGLNRYDYNSNSFTHFFHSDTIASSLSDDGVKALCVDRNGDLWVGTFRGINLMKKNSNSFVHYTIGPKKGDAANEHVRSILQDHEGNIWVGTENGLALYNSSSKTFRLFKHDNKNKNSLSNNVITSLMEDGSNNLWIGTQNGLNRLNREDWSFTRFLHEDQNENSLAHNIIWALANGANGVLWIGSENGLDLLDRQTGIFAHHTHIPGDQATLPHHSLRSVYMDNKGIVWVGTFVGGVSRYDPKLSQFSLYKQFNNSVNSLSEGIVTSFTEDKDGHMWIGTDGGGLNMWDRNTNKFMHFKNEKNNTNSLSVNTVLALLNSKSNEELWIGTYGGGVDVYHYKSRAFSHLTEGSDAKHLSDDHVYALLEDREGNVWIGTNENGVNVFNRKTKTLTKFLPGPPDGDHIINTCIRSFSEQPDGTIWIGTYGSGINIYHPDTKKFTYLDKNNADLSNNIVLSIFRDSKENIWVGTMGGLNFFDQKRNKFISFSEENGLPNNIINSIQGDINGNLWLSTKNGISRFNPSTLRFKNYSLYNGLQGYEFFSGSGLTSTTREIYFGGPNGFNVFNPAKMAENAAAPPVVITDFLLFNKPVVIGEGSVLQQHISNTTLITLPQSKSVISFEFAALDYTIPEKNQYAYMLQGFDTGWNYVGTARTATYTNLNPGEYFFKVKASNNDNVWNEQGTSIKIVITPPYWQTWWFRLLVILIVVGSAVLFYKMRVRAMKAHKLLLEQQVQERTQSLAQMTREERKSRHQLAEANKELERKNKELEQFAYVASHDLQEPLRTTSSFVELLQDQYKDKPLDEKADKYLTYIIQASGRMKVLINDLLEYSRIGKKKDLQKVDCNQVLLEVLADLGAAISEANAEIVTGSLPVINGYPTEIKQLFQNLIINAIKFRKKDSPPQIKICAQRNDDDWNFTVADNGIGIEEQHKDRIFVIFQRLHTRNEYPGSGIGLSHCKKIVELHKGKIWVDSQPGHGSAFHFTIRENHN